VSEGASELIQHRLLAFADLHGAEAHEPAFLRGVRRRLSGHDEPTTERFGLFRCRLLGDDRVHGTEFVEDLGAGVRRALGRLKLRAGFCFCWIMTWMSRATAASNSCWLGGTVAARSVAIPSFEISIGPPGSAIVIAIPATIGARRTRSHSSSVKDAFDVM
jgi:hypothetical protein